MRPRKQAARFNGAIISRVHPLDYQTPTTMPEGIIGRLLPFPTTQPSQSAHSNPDSSMPSQTITFDNEQGLTLSGVVDLPDSDPSKMNFGSGSSKPKSWSEIWGSGQGIGAIKEVQPAADLVARFKAEYDEAKRALLD